jgi:hypothetical protein
MLDFDHHFCQHHSTCHASTLRTCEKAAASHGWSEHVYLADTGLPSFLCPAQPHCRDNSNQSNSKEMSNVNLQVSAQDGFHITLIKNLPHHNTGFNHNTHRTNRQGLASPCRMAGLVAAGPSLLESL